MARIVINENDLTTATRAADNTDIAFVPGLMGDDGREEDYNTPILCQTVADFEYHFGKTPYIFKVAESYNGVEVTAGDADPSYIYAKELLSSGLQVVYEALKIEDYTLLKSQPDNFTTDYTSYYTRGTLKQLVSWADANVYVYKESGGMYSCLSLTDINFADATPNISDYYNLISSSNIYNNINSIASESTFTASWLDNNILKPNSNGSIYLKDVSSISKGQEYYIGIKSNGIPNITAKDMDKESNNNGLVIDPNGDIQYYEEGKSVAKGLVQDKAGNYYFISSSNNKAVRNKEYLFGDSVTNGLELPTGRYFWDANGVAVTKENVFAYAKKTAGDNTNIPKCAYIIGSMTDYSARAAIYSYANSLNGVYEKISSEENPILTSIYTQLADVYNIDVMKDSDIPSLNEKGEYSIKYITSGGYPNYGDNISLYGQMMNLAQSRGDAVALVDTVNDKSQSLNPRNSDSLYSKLQLTGISNGSFGAMIYPWVNVNLLNKYITATASIMPGSFAYLQCLAQSLKQGNANWLAIAGVTRGLVPNLTSNNPINLDKPLTNAIADYYQGTQPDGDAVDSFKYAINAITNIKPYGYCIWGNRTLASNADGQKATNYLNIRNAVSDIKKICYTSAKRLMFEQNDDILWTKFLSYITPTLDKMNSGSGISGYKVLKLATNEHAKLACKIIIFPVYAVENFEITVELRDEEITVEE